MRHLHEKQDLKKIFFQKLYYFGLILFSSRDNNVQNLARPPRGPNVLHVTGPDDTFYGRISTHRFQPLLVHLVVETTKL